MEAFTALSLFITGLIAGTFGGFLGVGGGFIMLPTLSLLFGYQLTTAIGTTITAIIFTAISGALGHLKMNNVDFKTAKLIAISGAFGAIIGSLAFFYLSKELWLLSILLGIVFAYTSLRMIYEGLKREEFEKKAGQIQGSKKAKVMLGFFVGFLVGILGLGGGFALVPSFVYIFGSSIKLAVGTSLASFLSMAIVSSVFKIYQGVVDLIAVLFLGLGAIFGAQIGARLIVFAPSWMLRLFFGTVFLYIAIRFILEGFYGIN
ncbi:MAG: sulfite exporter TauE/SafE family protein [Archaeoglobaceae archaeon]|nr:sulfite exporter TauE/SafE family protein [Archaeoglobaceae archaeon]MDW8117876.1 sulfite exporter TauE/SafE family protein [Archaeoglobaceae archaeon]